MDGCCIILHFAVRVLSVVKASKCINRRTTNRARDVVRLVVVLKNAFGCLVCQLSCVSKPSHLRGKGKEKEEEEGRKKKKTLILKKPYD